MLLVYRDGRRLLVSLASTVTNGATMDTNESKKSPPLSAAVKDLQKEFKLLEKEEKEIRKQRVQMLRDERAGTISKEQSNELDEKLHARISEIIQAMFRLTEMMLNMKQHTYPFSPFGVTDSAVNHTDNTPSQGKEMVTAARIRKK